MCWSEVTIFALFSIRFGSALKLETAFDTAINQKFLVEIPKNLDLNTLKHFFCYIYYIFDLSAYISCLFGCYFDFMKLAEQ